MNARLLWESRKKGKKGAQNARLSWTVQVVADIHGIVPFIESLKSLLWRICLCKWIHKLCVRRIFGFIRCVFQWVIAKALAINLCYIVWISAQILLKIKWSWSALLGDHTNTECQHRKQHHISRCSSQWNRRKLIMRVHRTIHYAQWITNAKPFANQSLEGVYFACAHQSC